MVVDSPTLGVLAPDADRTLLAVTQDGELAVALRERLDRSRVLVKDVRPEELEIAIRSCRPWPWMLVGAVPVLDAGAAGIFARPVLTLWYGTPPAGLPGHSRSFTRFAELAAAVSEALGRETAGMRLCIGGGVELAERAHLAGPELEALVSVGEQGFDLPLGCFRSAARVLARRGLPVRPVRDPESGRVRLGAPA